MTLSMWHIEQIVRLMDILYNRGKYRRINQGNSFLLIQRRLYEKGAGEMRQKINLEQKGSCAVKETDRPSPPRDHFSTSVKIDEIFTGS